MSILSKLTIRQFLGHVKIASSCQEPKNSKPMAKATALEKHPEASSQPEYEPTEDQLASFQYIGNIFKR